MSGTGIVDAVAGATVPSTNRAARKVLVNQAPGVQVAFYIPEGNDPPIGEPISWGPHHAWWGDQKVDKLSWELAPNAPLG